MIKFDRTEEFTLHDSSLVNIVKKDKGLILHVEDVLVEDAEVSMKILIENIESITKDGVIIENMTMETDDATVFDLEEENSAIVFSVIWRKYTPVWSDFCTYVFKGKDITVEICDDKPST